MNNSAAQWAVSAANQFRNVGRTTSNETTKMLAEGLTALAEAIRELDETLDNLQSGVK